MTLDAEVEWELNEWGGDWHEDSIQFFNGVTYLITVQKGTVRIKVPAAIEDKVKNLKGYVNKTMVSGKNFTFLSKCCLVCVVDTENTQEEGMVDCRLKVVVLKNRGQLANGKIGPVTWNAVPTMDGVWSPSPCYLEQDFEDCLIWKP